MYTLDTNAILYYLKADERAAPILEGMLYDSASLYISVLTEVELFGFPGLNPAEERQIDELIQTLAIIPVDSRIARIAATLRREYGVKLPDAVIAATALFTGSTLVTRNMRDFRTISNLSLQKI